jgi:hypothetical protein
MKGPGSSMVNVDSRPRSGWPFPGV